MNIYPNVLVVTNSWADSKLIEEVLEHFQINLIKATSSQDALEKTDGTDLAFAIIDAQMPEMSCYELLKEWNKTRPDHKTPVIFLTDSLNNELEIIKKYDLEIVDYIFKPVSDFLLHNKTKVFLELYWQQKTIAANTLLLSESKGVSKKKMAFPGNEKEYQHVVEQSFAGFLVTDHDGYFKVVNEAICAITGYSVDEIHSMTYHDLFIDGNNLSRMASQQGITDFQIQIIDLQILYKNGEKHFWTIEVKKNTRTFLFRLLREFENQKVDGLDKSIREEKTSIFLPVFPNAFIVVRLHDGIILAVNESFTAMFGYTKEEALNHTTLELNLWVDMREREIVKIKILNGVKISNENHRFRLKNKEVINVQLSSELIEINSELCFLSTLNVFNEQNRYGKERVENRNHLFNPSQLMPGVFYIFQLFPDGKSVFQYISSGGVTLYELSQPEIRQNPKLIFKLVHPEDRGYLIKRIFESASSGIPLEIEYRIILPQQGLCWRYTSAAPEKMDDGSVIWHGIITDYSENKQIQSKLILSEHRYKQLFESAREAILVVQKGMIKYANPALSKLFGYTSNEITVLPFLNLIYPADRDLVVKKFTKKYDYPSAINFKYRGFHKNGELKWFKVNGVLIDWNEHSASLYFHHDITSQKLAKEFETELLDISIKLTGIGSNEVPASLIMALSRIVNLFSADRADICSIDYSGNNFIRLYEWHRKEMKPWDNNLFDIPYEGFTKRIEMLRENQFLLIQDSEILDEDWKYETENKPASKFKSMVVVPLYLQNRLFGFVRLAGVIMRSMFSNAEINLFIIWGNIISGLLQRQKTGILMEQTRQNLETFFNGINDFLYVFDEKANILHCNSTVTNRLGYEKEELIGNPVLLLFPPELRDEVKRMQVEMLARTKTICKIPFMTKKGNRIMVETMITPGFWNGSPAIFGVTKDVTKLKLSEEKFAKVFYMNPSASGLSDMETGEYVEVNDAFHTMFGYSQEEAVGKTAVELGMVSESFLKELILKIKQNGNVRNLETKLIAKNGDIKDVILSAETIELQDRTLRYTVVHDVTQRNRVMEALAKSEKLLREAERIAKIGSWELNDISGDVTLSDGTYEIFGISPFDISPNNDFFISRIHPNDQQKVKIAIDSARQSKTPYSIAHRIILPSGQVRVVQQDAEIFYNDAGKSEKWIGTVQDITEKQKIEKRLLGAIKQQQRLIQYIEKVRENERIAISRELHDDLGQSLTAVMIDLAIICNTISDGELSGKINKVSVLISDTIKTVQRLTSQLRPEIINDLGLHVAIECYARDYSQRTLQEVEIKLDPEIHLSPDASLHIYRILQESLTNIARHAKASYIEIELSQKKDLINFSISDNGVGITDKKLKSIKSFGLISMQERSLSLGGKLEIRSLADIGTTIILTIPKK